MDLQIDKEFADRIPPLSRKEFEQLEANILTEGVVINPLIVWNGVVVDGHNRYRILQKHPEIPFQVHEKKFMDRYEVITWICKNQLGRRNLTSAQRKYLIGKQYEAEKARYGGDRKSGGAKSSYQNDNLIETERTCERIARENGIGSATVIRDEAYAAGIDAAEDVLPGIRQMILSGDIRPADKDVAAVARAPSEERKTLAQQLKQPRTSSRSDLNSFWETSQDEDGEEEEEQEEFKPSTASILEISRKMESGPEWEGGGIDTEFIILELGHALESMMYRWETCIRDYRKEAMAKDCQKKIRELVQEGIRFLKQYQRGVRDENDG